MSSYPKRHPSHPKCAQSITQKASPRISLSAPVVPSLSARDRLPLPIAPHRQILAVVGQEGFSPAVEPFDGKRRSSVSTVACVLTLQMFCWGERHNVR